MAAGSASILLLLQDERFKSALRSVGGALSSFQAHAEKVASKARIMLLAAGGVAAYAVKQQLDQEKAETRLAAVLRATGNAAGYSASQLGVLAGELQNTTAYGDDAILSMQAVLSAFTNIRGETFIRTTRAILDMATAMDMDLRSAAMGVGKALDQPAEALAGLSRLGVQFTEGQKKQIDAMIAANDFVGAQATVLEKLEAKFKGAAAAMGDTFGGKLSQLKNRLGDLGEVLGQILIPHLDKWRARLNSIIPEVERWLKANASNVVETAKWGVGLAAAAIVLPKITAGLMTMGKAAEFAVKHNKALLIALGAVAAVNIGKQVASRIKSEEDIAKFNAKTFSLRGISKAKSRLDRADTPELKAAALQEVESLSLAAAKDLREHAAAVDAAFMIFRDDIREDTAKGLIKKAERLEKDALAAHDARMQLESAAVEVAAMQFDKPETEASKAAELRLKQVQEYIDNLKLQADTFGMSQMVAEAYKLELLGITEAQRDEIRQGQATLTSLSMQQKYREKLQKATEASGNEILELTKELAVLVGRESSDSLELIDLENLGVAKEDLEKINALQKARTLILQEQALLQEDIAGPFQASIESLLDLHRRVQASAASGSKGSAMDRLRATNEQQRLLAEKANTILNSMGIKLEDIKVLLRNVSTSGGTAVYGP